MPCFPDSTGTIAASSRETHGRCSRFRTSRRRSSLTICSRAMPFCVMRFAAKARAGQRRELTELGATLGKPETVQLGFDANKFPPQLRTLDRYGHRLDEVEFHPAWHQLLEIALEAGLHSSPWANPKTGRARGTCRWDLHAGADRKRRVLPARDDLWLGPDIAACAANRRRMAAADLLARIRPPLSAGAT